MERNATTGAVGNKYKYGPFGESAATLPGTTIGYTGQRYDTELGLYHYKARYFHPGIGRFLQPDPVGYSAGMNLYAYCSNDGLNHTDPDGLDGVRIEYYLHQLTVPKSKVSIGPFSVTVGGGKVPGTHAAFATVDPKTGSTKLWEYGRFDKEQKGVVRTAEGGVKDLVMGKDGMPTPESYKAFKDDIRKRLGQNTKVGFEYRKNADAGKLTEFATRTAADKNRPDFSIPGNACIDFRENAFKEAEPGYEDWPHLGPVDFD